MELVNVVIVGQSQNLKETATAESDTCLVIFSGKKGRPFGRLVAISGAFLCLLFAGNSTAQSQSGKGSSSSNNVAVYGTYSRLFVSLWRAFDTVYKKMDGVAIVFDSSFSNGLGPEDASKINNSSDNIAIVTAFGNLSINGRKPIVAEDTIKLLVSQVTTTNYRLDVDASNYNSNGFKSYFKDVYLNKLTPLQPQVNSFTVAVDATKPATFQNRFQLIFLPVPLATENVALSGSLEGEAAKLVWNVRNASAYKDFVVERSIMGGNDFMAVATVPSQETKEGSFRYSDPRPMSGGNHYRVQARSWDGTVRYSETVTVEKPSPLAGLKIVPNPCTAKTAIVQLNGLPSGTYQLVVNNETGQTVITKKIEHRAVLSTYPLTGLTNGTYFVKLFPLSGSNALYSERMVVLGR